MQPIEFKAWPKTPRLFKDMTITEKLDGSNAAVIVAVFQGSLDEALDNLATLNAVGAVEFDNTVWLVGAQSRNRVLSIESDNFGFARWVQDNATGLAMHLGTGLHYGEWWGSGIQRTYDQKGSNKQFSLFNVHRYTEAVRVNAFTEGDAWVDGLRVVPVLYQGPFSEEAIRVVLDSLENTGSVAQPGYSKPEGIVIYHTAAKQVFKVLLGPDADLPKGLVA